MESKPETRGTLRRASALFATISVGVVLAACGGGGGGTELPAPAPPPVVPPPPPSIPKFSGVLDFQSASVVLGQGDFGSNTGDRSGAVGPATLDGPTGVAVGVSGGAATLFVSDGDNFRLVAYRMPLQSGQEAGFAVGQPGLFSDDRGDQPDDFAVLRAISIGDGKLAVADSDHNRVLIFDAVPVDGTARPVVVVGQPDMTETRPECDEVSLFGPKGVHITPDGKLVVADSNNSRVLIWEQVPVTSGQAATVVLGQPGFRSCNSNAGGGTVPSRNSMRFPVGVWSDGSKLAVADTANNRVLLWDSVVMDRPTGQSPDRQLGQPDFDTNVGAIATRDTLNSPRSVAFSGKHLAVADSDSHRVLLWNAWPSQDRHLPDNVLGQPVFDGSSPNDDEPGPGIPTNRVFNLPAAVAFHEDKLFVVDQGNHRVLMFQSSTTP